MLDVMMNPIGLIAGNGALPVLAAKGIRSAGQRVVAIGLAGQYHEDLPELCDSFCTVPIGRIGKLIRMLKKWHCQRASMVGYVRKANMFNPYRILEAVPDLRAVKLWLKHMKHDRRSNHMLQTVASEFERSGIQMIDAMPFFPQVLSDSGVMTTRSPTSAQQAVLQRGLEQVCMLGELDIGQAICVIEDKVLAVEGIEGTDAIIRRAGLLCDKGGWTLIKIAKPNQDMRFDVPTIGMRTIANLKAARAGCLALDAGKVIMLDKARVLKAADEAGIAIVGLDANAQSENLSTI